jgi:hypothetical protein
MVASRSLVFKVEKLLKGLKDLKIVRSGSLKPKEQTVAAEKHVTAAIVRMHRRQSLTTGNASSACVALEIC